MGAVSGNGGQSLEVYVPDEDSALPLKAGGKAQVPVANPAAALTSRWVR